MIDLSPKRGTDWAALAFWLIAFAAITLVLGANSRTEPQSPLAVLAARKPPPANKVPTVLPMTLAPVARDDAVAANARIPFVDRNVVPAAPFQFSGSGLDQQRARDCLAAAVLYEAGDDSGGQRSVAQVVLNRARHPAFPKSVCGVVFQGSERTTGCQFTFTCDGALNRRYSDAAWDRARTVADAALLGNVDARVGLATHYHTDWVRPYWSDSLEKIGQVDTHLFFRWPGFWGRPAAFRAGTSGGEPNIAKMAALSAAHAGIALTATGDTIDMPVEAVAIGEPRITAAAANALKETIYVQLDRRAAPETYVTLALRLCGDRTYCKFMGWTNPVLKPSGDDMNDMARAAMSFSYLRDEAAGFEKALWNCSEFKRDDKAQCMKR
ncbi:MAG: hypothetical protein RLZZ58_46 [Pseudomonadota bacterium]